MIALLEARRVSKVFGAGLVHKTETVALKDFSFTISGETGYAFAARCVA